jgi:isocitrate dehydrogenase (NAD+)
VGHDVTLIPGDGIGPEVIEAARRVIEATGVPIEWDRQDAGAAAFSRRGTPLPPETLASIRDRGVALKGPVETSVTSGYRSVNLELRKELGLFASVRPCFLYPGVPSVFDHVDLIVVRENLEDMYTGYEFEMGTAAATELIGFIEDATQHHIREDSGLSIKSITEAGSERVVRLAFELVRSQQRKKLTASHKANIMKFSDGLFLEVARRVATEYPEIEFEDRIIDALCMQLVQAPERFDVLVLPNFYGDVVSELGAALVGGLGVAPGGNFGDDGRAVFEATHGTAPRLAGTNQANPIGVMLSGAMLLRHIGETEAGDRLGSAVAAVLAEGVHVTRDLRRKDDARPAAGTFQVAEAVIAQL